MKFKENKQNKWERVFKILPTKTEDGYTVTLGHVYRMYTDDIFNPVRYHTDPFHESRGRLKEIAGLMGRRPGSNPMPPVKRPKRPPPPPSPPKPQVCPKCGTTDCIDEAPFAVAPNGRRYRKASHMMQLCSVRQQMKAMDKINFKGKKNTGSIGPR